MLSILNIKQNKSPMQRIIDLRNGAILVQVFLVVLVNEGFGYGLPWLSLLCVIATEIIFNIFCIAYYRNRPNASQKELLLQVVADVAFLTSLLYFSGGATNAFVSLLLIPIAISAVTLPTVAMIFVSLLAVSAYSLLLYLMPMHAMHSVDMQSHFIAMWVNFIFSAGVVSLVVGKMAREINKRELAIASYREEQLKQEQVLSIGVASAQITHQLATPIATVQLLIDELAELQPNNELIQDIELQLKRCRDNITKFRQLALDAKEQKITNQLCLSLIEQLQEHIQINFPQIQLSVDVDQQQMRNYWVSADQSLIPALLNLIQNGIRASVDNNDKRIEVVSKIVDKRWLLSIRDFGKGFSSKKLSELGLNPVASQQGLGMAVFLSHASLERLGGQLELVNHKDIGAVVNVYFPVVSFITEENSEDQEIISG